ncbi:DUF6160 family protein [Pseudomonas sp. GOM7]|uniref:DUF6160 family protein n=1 Tax=Pseudomonas sp. GOM7 TaxID=2998079 RepID=UPI00227BE03A|nr:DUF6160 family protein [Pseudomonas sp. GOM7]WAJ35676.1 DUF6160 family protein [Pseudomonas sp. GOM7]
MMTLKKIALAVAVVALPFAAHADLKALDDSALADVTGQAGISISGNFNATIGSVVYTDTADNVTDGSNTLSLNTVTLSGFNIDDNAPLTIDVADNKLQIGLPTINGQVSVGAVKVGDSTIGGLAINNLNMAGSTVKVWGH